ncbi:alpha-glucosidase [Loktanella sp. DSM 29012]|uniref:alpha-amylase family glycosyl hydrolase n=1 Tax=Loktanella sp. DSM 29012 TaxID=1881056 RepID=UPI0008C020DE|nr:alpha-amylase family glycosyl hydrolase [Loktanella sp. DSM 29012]SEP63158.1 alpha-glucosidase [Loktanella sp. DSM 29012]
MTDLTWWQRGIIYQVYPRSFQDSDGDGIGDLRGITQRLDHIVDLGADIVWISPIFPSPMKDFGYDISDYRGIDPMFGTLADFDAMIDAAHARGLRVLLDFVPSHTSDQHPWFVESRSARNSDKRDWYIWRDAGPDGGPPTNWISEFGPSTWAWDDQTQQYYLHIFLTEQPALNWRNPAVQAEMLDTMRFWYDRGVDGFRVDAITHAAPDVDKGDHPVNPDWHDGMNPSLRLLKVHSKNQPMNYDIVRMMRAVTQEYPDRLLLGETDGTLAEVTSYYGTQGDGFQLPFNFALLDIPWTVPEIVRTVEAYEAALPDTGWPTWVVGNHDCIRIASRVGSDLARVALTLLLTLRGTPTVYQGDELGMQSADIPPELVQDPWEKQVPGKGLGRDPARTPMPWDDSAQAGFTDGTPWLPVFTPPDGTVAGQAAGDTMLAYVKRLTALRQTTPALLSGEYRTISAADDLLVYARGSGDDAIIICLNFADAPRDPGLSGHTLLSSANAADGPLHPSEARLIRPT